MRPSKRRLTAIAPALLTFLIATHFSAAAQALNEPNGLALDSQGNLYVANYAGSNILVYDPNYNQLSGKTITKGISFPTSVAFDPLGNLWVLNVGSSSATQYTNGVQNTGATITTGLSSPTFLTVDGLGDVYVQNDDSNMTVYAPATPSGPATSLIETLTPTSCMQCIGNLVAAGQALYWSKGNGAEEVMISTMSTALRKDMLSSISTGVQYSPGMGADNAGNAYLGTLDGALYIAHPNGTNKVLVANLGFVPYGVAVDNARKRVYLANQYSAQIVVYSTAGVYLHTIM